MEADNESILIIDDQPANLQVLRAMLVNHGYEVRAAVNGPLALRLAHAARPDLILLDIMMPEMDGFEVCITLKANPATADIPVIFLSALEKPESKLRAFEVGGVDYIAKPFHAGEVLARVKTHLALRRMQHALVQKNQALAAESARRQEAAAALHMREEILNQAQSIGGMGDWVYDADQKQLHLSQELQRILGVQGKTKTIDQLARRLRPADRPRLRDAFAALLGQGAPIELDVRINRGAAPAGTLLVRGRLIDTGDGTQPRAMGIVQDITERKQAEEALRQLTHQLNEAQAIAHIGSWELDVHTGHGIWSDEARRLVALDDNSPVGPGALLPRIIAEDQQRVAAALAAAIDGGADYDLSFSVQLPDGSRRLLHSRALLVRDEQGRATHLRGTMQDITSREQAETALRQSNLRLERTLRDLRETQQNIVRQERLAAVGELASGIAHDFNNLIATMVLYADLLQMSATMTEKDKERLNVIRSQGQHAAELTQQILDFSRQSAIVRQKVDLHHFFKEWRQLLGRMLPENISLRLHSAPGECLVFCDVTRLQQVVLNLAINARDAMPDGGRFELSLRRIHFEQPPLEEADMVAGDWVVIMAGDTGSGIPPEILPRIFEPFFTTKDRDQGHGLGLAQVFGIISQHDGYVDVQTDVGEGTTFSIFLPAQPLPDAARPPALQEVFPLGNGEMVLVVEDDDHVRAAVVASLQSLNYATTEAENGRRALDLFATDPATFDVVLSDLMMPEMGGTQLLREFRQTAPSLKLLAMTGHPPAVHTLARSEVDAWLNKPINLQQLARTLHDVINRV